MFNSEIIREYDIRGIYGKTLVDNDAFAVGWAFAKYVKANASNKTNLVINVCRDGRLSSPSLTKHLIDGIITGGISVNDIGIGPTPLLYFSHFYGNAIAGIMVTGSHNPSEYNGFKFIFDKQPFFGKQIEDLYELSHKYLLSEYEGAIKPKVHQLDFSDQYAELLRNVYPKNSTIKVVWDPGNGAAASILNKLCKNLPGEHILINSKIDGTFPSHHPDPTIPENLEILIDVVKDNKYDIGIAFDGDGDRIGVVDRQGRILWGDQLLNIFAKDILQRNPGASIIADVKASDTLFQEITKLGGNPIMCKTGHSNIKKKMKETKALLAGEMSGHIFIADNYFGYDDALYAAMRLIDILTRWQISIDELLNQMPVIYNTPEIRIKCPEALKFKIIDEIKAVLQKENIQGLIDIDGIRLHSTDGWWLLRASNTQDVLVCRIEGKSLDAIKRQKQIIESLLAPYQDYIQEKPLITV